MIWNPTKLNKGWPRLSPSNFRLTAGWRRSSIRDDSDDRCGQHWTALFSLPFFALSIKFFKALKLFAIRRNIKVWTHTWLKVWCCDTSHTSNLEGISRKQEEPKLDAGQADSSNQKANLCRTWLVQVVISRKPEINKNYVVNCIFRIGLDMNCQI